MNFFGYAIDKQLASTGSDVLVDLEAAEESDELIDVFVVEDAV